MAKEWNYEKNIGLTPMDVSPNSDKKVWWVCNKGHEWQATIGSRNRGNGCPVCHSEQNTSFPEYAIVFYLEKYGLETIHSYKERGYELDIYIPSKKVAIEYDGYFWHQNKTKQDLIKNRKCINDRLFCLLGLTSIEINTVVLQQIRQNWLLHYKERSNIIFIGWLSQNGHTISWHYTHINMLIRNRSIAFWNRYGFKRKVKFSYEKH